MGLELKTSLRMSQQLVMTPQLQQAIKLLQLGRLELVDTIQEELLENPLLEVEEDAEVERSDAEKQQADEAKAETAKAETADEAPVEEFEVSEKAKEEFDWENYLGEYSSAPSSGEGSMRESQELPSYDNVMTKPVSLKDHLLWQLRMAALDEVQMEIGAVILENLNRDGYLQVSLDDLAELRHTTPDAVERVLKVIQLFDPVGVGARDLAECLIVQASELYPANDLLFEVLENHLPDLERRNYKAIARKQKVSIDDVADILDIIRSLDPKPGRTVSDEQPQYITPDIYLYKMDGEWVIVLNEDGLPKLKINKFYKESLGAGASPEAKEYVQSKLRGALWLIRSIHQRQRTIQKVARSLVKFQKDFFEKGIDYLKPLVLRDVAEDVGMHESTISRVTTNKYIHTPQGVYELKFFFNSSINRVQGEALASEAVKDRIRRMIAAEDPAKPLSDQAIADKLRLQNIDIARRTVAKYRELLRLLPSSRRRQPLKSRAGKSR